MTELQQNRYDQLLRRVGDLKGSGSKVNDVLSELFPMIDVENVPGELLFLMGTKVGWAGTSLQAGAGQTAGIQLFNPAGSGHLVTITRVLFNSVIVGHEILYGNVDIALPTNTDIPRIRDGRAGVGPSGVSQLRTTIAAVGPIGGRVRVNPGFPFTLEDANGVSILPPGAGMSVVSTISASLIGINFFYRERLAEPSELNF